MKRTLLLCLALTVSHAFAAADIEGRVELPSGNFVAPGAVGKAVLTIKNNGPDAAETSAVGTVYFGTVGFRTIELVSVSETPPCLVQYSVFVPPPIPPRPATVSATVQTLRGLAPGETFSCTVGLGSYPEASSLLRVRVNFVSEQDDPNPSNNEVFFDIRTRAELISVPAVSNVATALMILLLLACGVRQLFVRG